MPSEKLLNTIAINAIVPDQTQKPGSRELDDANCESGPNQWAAASEDFAAVSIATAELVVTILVLPQLVANPSLLPAPLLRRESIAFQPQLSHWRWNT